MQKLSPKRQIRRTGSMIVLSLLVLPAALASCSRPPDSIVTGSTLIEGVVVSLAPKEGAASAPRIQNLMPPGMCPGHFDVKPTDVVAVSNCRAFVVHGWQSNMPSVQGLLAASGISKERVRTLATDGNWMVPEVYAEGIREVAGVLKDLDPANGAGYDEQGAALATAAAAAGASVRKELLEAGAGDLPVLCSDKQEPFLLWAGFNVVASYGRPADLSVAEMESLVAEARKAKTALVIDNLQSGDAKMGAAIARDSDAVHVVLSNFPGGFEGTDTWEASLRRNKDLLLESIGKWAAKHDGERIQHSARDAVEDGAGH